MGSSFVKDIQDYAFHVVNVISSNFYNDTRGIIKFASFIVILVISLLCLYFIYNVIKGFMKKND